MKIELKARLVIKPVDYAPLMRGNYLCTFCAEQKMEEGSEIEDATHVLELQTKCFDSEQEVSVHWLCPKCTEKLKPSIEEFNEN